MDTTKTCTRCGVTKPLPDFVKSSRNSSGYRTTCLECNRARNQKWTAENKTKMRAAQNKYRLNNHDKHRAAKQRWERNHPDRCVEYTRRKKARKEAAGVYVITEKDQRRIDAEPCRGCGTRNDLQIDHNIPTSRGGQTSVGNTQRMCRECNASKGTLPFTVWAHSNRPRAIAVREQRLRDKFYQAVVGYGLEPVAA